jgi:hypothetical protein
MTGMLTSSTTARESTINLDAAKAIRRNGTRTGTEKETRIGNDDIGSAKKRTGLGRTTRSRLHPPIVIDTVRHDPQGFGLQTVRRIRTPRTDDTGQHGRRTGIGTETGTV